MNQFDTYPIIDIESLEETRDIVEDKFPVIVNFYLEDTPKYMTALKEGLDESDHKKIVEATHTIKSSSRQLGAIRTSEIAAAIETSGNNLSDISEILPLAESLRESYEGASRELRRMIEGYYFATNRKI